ncbi:hypothetical protein AR457_40730 [Streptomyces agglomeratus]|nr:hypothetical protein AR457_40730 [Streptomyces agglomeratus]
MPSRPCTPALRRQDKQEDTEADAAQRAYDAAKADQATLEKTRETGRQLADILWAVGVEDLRPVPGWLPVDTAAATMRNAPPPDSSSVRGRGVVTG